MKTSRSFCRAKGPSTPRVAALVALAFATGWLACGLLPSGRSGASTSVPGDDSVIPNVVGPRSYTNGIPSGFAHSEEGARAAAVGYVLTGQTLMNLSPAQVIDAVRVMAASDPSATQVAEADAALRGLRERLAGGTGPTRYLQAVLATRVDEFTSERTRVSVWSVGVLARSGVAPPQAGWTISTFELVWEHQDWKVWSETISAGPAPDLNASALPASSAEFDRALFGFIPWRSGR